MPIENEQKFILSLDVEEDIKNNCPLYFKIQQGYLSANAVIRVTERMGGQMVYEFIYKQKTNTGTTFVTHNRITEDDFETLREEVKSVVIKTRYWLYTIKGAWEIDFLKNDVGETYFALAEYKMPEWQESPEILPGMIQRHLLKTIDKDDVSFSDKRLSNEAYAVKKLKVILNKKNTAVKKTKKKIRTIEDVDKV